MLKSHEYDGVFEFLNIIVSAHGRVQCNKVNTNKINKICMLNVDIFSLSLFTGTQNTLLALCGELH